LPWHAGAVDRRRDPRGGGAQRAVDRAVGVRRLLGSWPFIRTSARLIRNHIIGWCPGSVQASGAPVSRPAPQPETPAPIEALSELMAL
jgi:hypothetical protein